VTCYVRYSDEAHGWWIPDPVPSSTLSSSSIIIIIVIFFIFSSILECGLLEYSRIPQ